MDIQDLVSTLNFKPMASLPLEADKHTIRIGTVLKTKYGNWLLVGSVVTESTIGMDFIRDHKGLIVGWASIGDSEYNADVILDTLIEWFPWLRGGKFDVNEDLRKTLETLYNQVIPKRKTKVGHGIKLDLRDEMPGNTIRGVANPAPLRTLPPMPVYPTSTAPRSTIAGYPIEEVDELLDGQEPYLEPDEPEYEPEPEERDDPF